MNGETYAQEMILHVWLGPCLDVRNICLLLDTFHPSFSLSLLYPSFLEPPKRLHLSCFWRDTHLKWNYLDLFKPTHVAQGEGCRIYFLTVYDYITIILLCYVEIQHHEHPLWLGLPSFRMVWYLTPIECLWNIKMCCPKAQLQCPHRHFQWSNVLALLIWILESLYLHLVHWNSSMLTLGGHPSI